MKGHISIGHPVDVATGSMHNTYLDISITGRVNLTWDRFYSTNLADKLGPFGPGWFNCYFCTLTYKDKKYIFVNKYGLETSFNDHNNKLAQGISHTDFGTSTTLTKHNNIYHVTQWDIDSGEIWIFLFEQLPDGNITALKELSDITGQSLILEYDLNERLVSIKQKLEQRALVIKYNQNDLIEQIDFLSSDNTIRHRQVKYSYDDKDRLSTVTDNNNKFDYFLYDKNNCVIKESRKDGKYYEFKYDTKKRCICAVGVDGYDRKTLRYLKNAQWTEVTDSLGNTRRFHYNADGQVLHEIDPLGAEYFTDYDEYGRIFSKTDPLGGKTTFEYDEFGNRNKITNALGHISLFEYNDNHLPISYTNALGDTWRRTYDKSNRLTSVIDPEGNTYKLLYDKDNNLIKAIDPINNYILRKYNNNGVLSSSTDWNGNTSFYEVDAYGNLVKLIDPLGSTTQFFYDVLSRITTIQFSDGTSVLYEYDAGSNLTKIIDRSGNTTEYKYTACGRLLERIDALNNKLYFNWGTEPSRLESVTNAKGEVYHIKHNAVGWVISETGFDGRDITFEYDLVGNLIKTTNGLNECICYKRNALGKIIEQILPDGTKATFTFDPVGFIQSATNPSSHIKYERNSLGKITHEIQNGHIIKRKYDSIGNLIQLETSLGHKVNYNYDANGLLTSFTRERENTVQITRDARGSELNRSFNNILLTQKYDTIGRLLQQELYTFFDTPSHLSDHPSTPIIKRNYLYEGSELVHLNDSIWGSETYTYDSIERLVKVVTQNTLETTFNYDANDNITRIYQNKNSRNFIYSRGNQLKEADNVIYEFDNQGRLVTKTEFNRSGDTRKSTFTWNALDQLQSFKNPEQQTWRYAYDVFGRRIAKISPDGKTHSFIWDTDVVLHELDNGELYASWLFDPYSFSPLCKFEKHTMYTIISNHQGTPREMIDQYGNLAWQANHHTWGGIKETKSDKCECPVLFQGQWYDKESGLAYNRFRYYNPDTGSYISQDPIGLEGGINVYSYVHNPIRLIDPYGLHTIFAWIESGNNKDLVGSDKGWPSTTSRLPRSARGTDPHGAIGHSEWHILNHLDNDPRLPGNRLVLVSTGQEVRRQ
ncbi:MAG: RHS repeat-associated core domain-containing protein, partial [Candidatus Thiodiazotropha sp.]